MQTTVVEKKNTVLEEMVPPPRSDRLKPAVAADAEPSTDREDQYQARDRTDGPPSDLSPNDVRTV